MGTIMAVVAVLLIHMDRKAVTTINPSMRLKREKRAEEKEERKQMLIDFVVTVTQRVEPRQGCV